MYKLLIVFMLLSLLLLPAPANAQNDLVIDSLDVSLWPEYDTSTVLVIYKIALAPQTTLPTEITLRLPSSVGKTAVVAVGDTPQTVSDQNVDTQFAPGTDFARVTVKATGLYVQVEYYDPGLAKVLTQREFTYQWLGDYSVNKFRFEMRQPLQSSNLSVEPALTSIGADTEGFQLSEFKKASIKAGQVLPFVVKYQRATDSPSTTFLKVESSSPLTQTVPGQSTWTTYLPWILGGLGLALLLIAAAVYWSSSKSTRELNKSRKRHVVRAEVESQGADDLHCSQCGKRAKPADRFCRACGARIRRSDA